MDELIDLVAQKTGLSKEMSKTAVETVIGYLKKKLPAPIASQVDSVLSGSSATGGAGGIVQGLGGLLRKK